MSYLVQLGDIAERYHERTGEKYIYSLKMQHYSGDHDEFYIIAREADSNEPIDTILNLYNDEAYELMNLLCLEFLGESADSLSKMRDAQKKGAHNG